LNPDKRVDIIVNQYKMPVSEYARDETVIVENPRKEMIAEPKRINMSSRTKKKKRYFIQQAEWLKRDKHKIKRKQPEATG